MKKDSKIKFGFCIPIFANPGMAFFRTPAYTKLDWDSLRETVLSCERLGYDSIFVADHLFLGQDGEIWECMTLMSALAAITSKVHIIPIHLCNNFRIPSVVAKMLATLSHISNGRVELFYDYGWRKAEFDAYGIDFCSTDKDRVQQMEEGLIIIKGMLNEGVFSYKGEYYTVKDAVCSPRPVKKLPIWMGEANNSEMVCNIVKHADIFNSMPCSIDGFQKKLNVIKAECERQGRNFSEMGLSLETQVLIREKEEEVDRMFEVFNELKKCNNSYDADILEQLKKTNTSFDGYDLRKNIEEEFMIGTPQNIKQKLDKFVEMGVSHFMLWFMDYPDRHGIKLFAETVMSYYKAN